MMDRHPLIERYLAEVCSHVKARELHKEIKQELADHLEELIALKREEGLGEDEAVKWAVNQMGDADSAGAGLNRVHRPRVAWGLFAGLAVLLVISLVAMYAVQLSYSAMGDSAYRQLAASFVFNKAVFIAIGFAAALTLTFMDYRKLRYYSWFLYIATMLLMLFAVSFGQQVNGARAFIYIGGFGINWLSVSPYFLIVAIAGIFADVGRDGRSAWLHLLLFVVLPAVLIVSSRTVSPLFVYMAAYMLLLTASRKSWKQTIPPAAVGLIVLAGYTLSRPYATDRLLSFWDRSRDPLGSGYMYVQIDEAIRSAGWWGHGLAAVNRKLPLIHTDALFTYLIYSLGWIAGCVIVCCAGLFMMQLVRVAVEVRDRYGKLIIAGLTGLFAVQFVWTIGMSFGVLPIAGMSIPLIGYGGSQLLVQMASLGLIAGIYRRKDMIRASMRAKI